VYAETSSTGHVWRAIRNSDTFQLEPSGISTMTMLFMCKILLLKGMYGTVTRVKSLLDTIGVAWKGRCGVIDSMSEDDHYLILRVDFDQIDEVRKELLEPLRSPEISADIPPTGGGVPQPDFPAYIGMASGLITIAQGVASALKTFRRKQREARKKVGVHYIRRPNRERLDFYTATDDEVDTYITEDRIGD